MDEKESACCWLFLFLDSLRADLRINSNHELSDIIRSKLNAAGYKTTDLPVKILKVYRDEFRKHRKMPNASIVELEMF
jgi:hypothetical protein